MLLCRHHMCRSWSKRSPHLYQQSGTNSSARWRSHFNGWTFQVCVVEEQEQVNRNNQENMVLFRDVTSLRNMFFLATISSPKWCRFQSQCECIALCWLIDCVAKSTYCSFFCLHYSILREIRNGSLFISKRVMAIYNASATQATLHTSKWVNRNFPIRQAFSSGTE